VCGLVLNAARVCISTKPDRNKTKPITSAASRPRGYRLAVKNARTEFGNEGGAGGMHDDAASLVAPSGISCHKPASWIVLAMTTSKNQRRGQARRVWCTGKWGSGFGAAGVSAGALSTSDVSRESAARLGARAMRL